MKFINEHLGWFVYGTGVIAVAVGAAIGCQSIVPLLVIGGISLVIAGAIIGMNRHNNGW